MTDTARRRTAHHEAAHAVAAHVYGFPIQVLSIRPGHGFHGITMLEWVGVPEPTGGFDASTPVLLQRLETRAAIERRILVSLAGPASDVFATAPTTGYIGDIDPEPDSDEAFAAKTAKGLADQSPRHRELMVDRENAPAAEFRSDDDTASNLSWALVGTESAAHVGWLRASARDLVMERWHQIHALAEALLERTVLSGDDVVAILTASRWRSR